MDLKLHVKKDPGPRCPSCGAEGIPVKEVTLRSLLCPDRLGLVVGGRWSFCGSAGCDVVYFKADGGQVFNKDDLAVRVGVKETSAPRPICYCFGHTIEEVMDEVRRTGGSTVAQDIRARMKESGCSCEVKNPQGRCCLDTVGRCVDEAVSLFGVEVDGKRK